jgi:hypothetical protein
MDLRPYREYSRPFAAGGFNSSMASVYMFSRRMSIPLGQSIQGCTFWSSDSRGQLDGLKDYPQDIFLLKTPMPGGIGLSSLQIPNL